MTAGAPLARTARERGSSTLHRMLADARVALFVAYVAMVIWRFRGGGTPATWWMYVLAYAALNTGLDCAARLQRWWIWRRSVHALRAMDPTHRDERLARVWMSGTRRVLADMVAGEGDADIDGAIERYPFAGGARRAAAGTLWAMIAAGITCCVALIVLGRKIVPWARWTLWGVATVLGIAAAWARSVSRHMDTTLEISAYGITEVDAEGGRTTVRWNEPLLLRARPRLRRLELLAARRSAMIALDYDRVGIDGAVRLVIERGGFAVPEPDATGAPGQSAK